MIDTHCHIDMYPNPMEVVNESERLGIVTIGMTNLPSHFIMGYPHLKNCKKTRLALGMHPLMAEKHDEEFPLFCKHINKTSYIGEIGLDFSKEGLITKEKQVNSFKKILGVIGNKPKILSIHSRRAEKEVLHLLKEYQISNAIFHWFSGDLKLVNQIADAGYFFSINPYMINSASGRKIINRIPKEFILTETDGPYVSVGNRTSMPKDVALVILYLSKLLNKKNSEVEGIIESNFRSILNKINI